MAFIPRDFDFAAYEDQEIAKIVAPDAFTEFTIKRYITSILKDILQHLDANYDTYERIPLLNKKTDVCSNTRSHLGDLNMYMEEQDLDLTSFVKNVQKLRGNLVEEVPFTKKAIQEKALTITGNDGTARWLITLLATNFILMPFGLTPHEELPYFIPTALLITHIVAALEIKNQKKIYKKIFRAVLPLIEKLGVLASEEDILYSEGLKDMRSQPSTILAFLDGPIAQIIKKETAHASNKIQELTNALAKLKAEESSRIQQ